MRAATCLILLLSPAVGRADDTKAPGSRAVREAEDKQATVGGIQGGKPLKFGDNLGTYYEGLVVALLGSCTADSSLHVGTKEHWEKALKRDHLRVQFEKPRRFAVTGGRPGGGEMEADEILVPISTSQGPDHIFVRAGNTYRAFAKYQHKICKFIQDELRELPGR
jgi:hypothetical protein